MKPWTSGLARLGLAGSCLVWAGCGGGNVPDPESDANLATGAPSGAAAAPAPAAARNGAPVAAPEAAAPAAPQAATPAAPPTDASSAAADEAAPAEGSGEKTAGKSEPPSATNEMLALASAAAPSPEKSGEAADQAAAPGAGGPMGMSMGMGAGMGSGGYPGAGGPAMDPRMMKSSIGMQGGQAGAMSPPGGAGDPRAMAGAQGMPGFGGAGGNNGKPDFRNPVTAVGSFLQAVHAKDPERLAEATALHAGQPTETKPNYQKVFLSIIEQSLLPEDLDELAKKFEGVQIMGQNEAKSSGRCDVIVGKSEGTDTITRSVTVRKEKSGWKVVDIGGARKIPSANMMPSGRGRRR